MVCGSDAEGLIRFKWAPPRISMFQEPYKDPVTRASSPLASFEVATATQFPVLSSHNFSCQQE